LAVTTIAYCYKWALKDGQGLYYDVEEGRGLNTLVSFYLDTESSLSDRFSKNKNLNQQHCIHLWPNYLIRFLQRLDPLVHNSKVRSHDPADDSKTVKTRGAC